MSRIAELFRQILFRLGGEQVDREMDEEMRLHMELRAEQARAQGLDPDAAAAAARRRFGNPTLLREDSRDAWGWTYVDGWLRDIREAFRTLRSSPGFTAVAVISLALGIGANTAIFSLINALLLRELPVEDPRELVLVTMDEAHDSIFTNPIWEQIRDHQEAFAGAFAFTYARFDLAPKGEVDWVEGLWVSGGFFRTLGVAPLRGRMLGPEDDRRGCGADGPVAVISERLWETRYGRDEGVVGRTITLDRKPFRVVGVTPRWFRGLDADRAYSVAIPLGCDPVLRASGGWLDKSSLWWLHVMGRLPDAGSLHAVGEHLRALSPGVFEATVPAHYDDERQADYRKRTLTLREASTGFSSVGNQYGRALYALLGIAGLVLLVACANVANLLLVRSAQRSRELSMRMALGAGRARLVRRLLCESLLIASLGAVVGLVFALAGGRALVRLLQTEARPILVNLSPDAHVLGFTTSAALLTALLFGLAPAFRATRIRLNDVLKEGVRGGAQAPTRVWLGKAVVAAQVALSLILLAACALFVDTMRNLTRESLGFEPRGLTIVAVDVGVAGIEPDQRREMFPRLL